MMRHGVVTTGLLAAAVLLGGCGKAPPPPIVPVEGTLLLNGAPLPRAQVRFVPMIEYGTEFIATAVTDDQGRFTLTCNGQPGACAIENHVVVADEIPERLTGENAQRELAEYRRSLKNRPIPPKYATLGESPLRVAVKADQKEYKVE